jgi:hypothetical protein
VAIHDPVDGNGRPAATVMGRARKARAEGPHQRRRQRAAQAGWQADVERARRGATLALQFLARALYLLQDAASMRQQPRTGFGDRDATAVAAGQLVRRMR